MKRSLLETLRRAWNAGRRPAKLLRRSLRGWTFPADHSQPDLVRILAQWNLGDGRAERIAMGGSTSNWIVHTAEGPYVLRNAGPPSSHIDFQILVLNHLAASGFPYETPRLRAAGETYCYQWQNQCWLLYPFIHGHPLRQVSSKADATAVGRLVACYHRSIDQGEWSRGDLFPLSLFATEKVCSDIHQSITAAQAHKKLADSYTWLVEVIGSVLDAYVSIPDSEKQRIRQLKPIPVYNDWHGDNILVRDGELVGLIDFDSLNGGPHLVDIQNALLYAAGTPSGFDADRIIGFVEGYRAVRSLSRSEVELVYPLMVDRLVSLIARNLGGGTPESARDKTGLITFVASNLAWAIERREELERHLASAAKL